MAYHRGINKFLPVIMNSLEQVLNGNFYWFQSRNLLMENTGLSAALMKVKTELTLPLADVNPPLLAFPTRQTLRFLTGNLLQLSAPGAVTVIMTETACSAWLLDLVLL